jgi:ferredoxin-NADP reductase
VFNPVKIIRKVQESQNIYSFYLQPSDEKSNTHFKPGQHINVRISLPGTENTIIRPYTLSSAPGQPYYRITVKREDGHSQPGIVSGFLHDHVQQGDTLWISEPQGTFVLPEDSRRPVILISAGVGITPMLSMVETIAAEPDPRKVWIFHSSKNKRLRPMAEMLRTLADNHDHIRVYIHHSMPSDDEIAGDDYDAAGRIDLDFLKKHLPDHNADFYLCGPESFIQNISDGLLSWGVSKQQIAFEYFNRAANDKQLSATENKDWKKEPELNDMRVSLTQSRRSLLWDHSYGSLLDLLEANEIFPPSSCRMGTCMSCSTGLLSGEISYEPEPLAEPFEGDILLCCARPQTDLQLDL